MIEVKNLSKSFGDIVAVDHVSVNIKESQVFGLIGTNGAGKSTTLRMISGVFKPDEGDVFIDGEKVYHNVNALSKLFFIPDEPYFFSGANTYDLVRYYKSVFPAFDQEKFYTHLSQFSLDPKRKVQTFSKGMKKQLIMLLGLCANTPYLLCDETFDGLDPVMRQGIKSLIAKEMDERNLTCVIASHNLRELEDICDHVGLLHKGGVLLSKDMFDLKCNIQKVQCVFKSQTDEVVGLSKIDIVKKEQRGSLFTLTIRGTREEVIAHFTKVDTVFFEILPLTLEEVFISETEVAGYDIKALITA